MTAREFQRRLAKYGSVKQTLANHFAPTPEMIKEFIQVRNEYKAALKDVAINGVSDDIEGGVEAH